ncbi:MAG: hypothetical protein KF774_15125 [Planctomyces sp.]|nr:hypothetical protein [Planctomyces sp.]
MMRSGMLCVMVSLAAAQAVAQNPRPGSPDAIRAQIEKLQEQLDRQLQDAARGSEEERKMRQLSERMAEADGQPVMVLRAYDLVDLFVPITAYPAMTPKDLTGESEVVFPLASSNLSGFTGAMGGAMGGMGAGGGGFFQIGGGAIAGSDVIVDLQSLRDVIFEMTPGPWDEVDGEGGRIVSLGNTLLVSTTLENQLQVENLLMLLREKWGRPKLLNVEVDWLWLTPEELDELAPIADGSARRVMTREALDSLRNADDEQRPASRSMRIACYNGQTVSQQSLRQIPVVASLTTVMAQEAAGYQPQVRALSDGVIAQVTPLVSRSGKHVDVNLQSLVNDVVLDDPSDYDAQSPRLDRPALRTHRFATTVRAAVGATTLAGGMSHLNAQEAAGNFALYVFVTTFVEEIREAQAPDAPALDEESSEAAKAEEPATSSRTESAPRVGDARDESARELLRSRFDALREQPADPLEVMRRRLVEQSQEIERLTNRMRSESVDVEPKVAPVRERLQRSLDESARKAELESLESRIESLRSIREEALKALQDDG